MPTPFEYDPETIAEIQKFIGGLSNPIPKAYPPPEGTEDPFSQFHTIRKILSGDLNVLGAPPPYPPKQAPSPANEPGGEGFGLAGVMQQPPDPGWQTVPGTQAFSGGTGRWRQEFPLEGAIPPGDAASRSWLDYNRAKYGTGYTNERTVGTPEYEAGGAASLRYSNLVDQILKTAEAQKRSELLGKPLEDVFTNWGTLGKSEEAITAAREARAEKEQQRNENAWLLQQYLGLGAGVPPGGGVSEKTLKTGTTLAHERRAQEGAERADRRLEGMERRERLARPNEAALSGRAADMLAREKGYAVKRIEGSYYVYKNATSRTPIADSAKVWADARQRAETELRSGAP